MLIPNMVMKMHNFETFVNFFENFGLSASILACRMQSINDVLLLLLLLKDLGKIITVFHYGRVSHYRNREIGRQLLSMPLKITGIMMI